jgi:hypothetical protein
MMAPNGRLSRSKARRSHRLRIGSAGISLTCRDAGFLFVVLHSVSTAGPRHQEITTMLQQSSRCRPAGWSDAQVAFSFIPGLWLADRAGTGYAVAPRASHRVALSWNRSKSPGVVSYYV